MSGSLVVTRLQCQAHADISHNELVLLRLAGGMERGEVDARGGMVAGSVLMQDVQAQGMLLTLQPTPPASQQALCPCSDDREPPGPDAGPLGTPVSVYG